MKICAENVEISIGKVSEIIANTYGFGSSLMVEKYDEIIALTNNNEDFREPHPIDKSTIKTRIENFDRYYLTGLDLPIWVNSGNDNKRIIILASEPLRSDAVFTEVYDNFNIKNNFYSHILVGTPFAYHYINPGKTDSNLYWDIIDYMAQEAFVYITDIRKIWFAGFEYHKNFINAEYHKAMLEQEIDMVNPDVVVTFGNNANSVVSKMKFPQSIKHINLIHPSKRTIPQRDKFFKLRGIDVTTFNNSTNKQFDSYKALLDKEMSAV